MIDDRQRPRLRSGRPSILCVDDEPAIRRILERLLGQQGFEVETAADAESALARFDESAVDLVVTDINLPGMDGHSLLRRLRDRDPALPVVVVTGQGTLDTAIRALRAGATGMLVKPFTSDDLLAEVGNALLSARLRHDALQYRFLSPVLDSIALALSTAIEARHLETGEHCRQIGELSERIGIVLGVDERTQMTVRIAGYLHDVGKIGIPDAILLKPGLLDDAEMAEMRRHSEIGASILGVHEAMAEIAQIVRHHHEHWNGAGYPDHVAGSAIPFGARIIAVADAYSAMTADRVYRRALPIEQAWLELRKHAGRQFDPEIVRAFGMVVDETGGLRPIDTLPTTPSAVHVPPPETEAAAAWPFEPGSLEAAGSVPLRARD